MFFIITTFFLLSCTSDSGIIKNTPQEINTIGNFFLVWGLLEISIIIISMIFFFTPLGPLGYIISFIGHFLWILIYRNDGFVNILLLAILSFIVTYIVAYKHYLHDKKSIDFNKNNGKSITKTTE